MAEWLNAAVSKTVIPGNWDRGFESPPLRMYFTYILKSIKDGSFYYGSTLDISARLKQHNSGKVKYTKGHRPWIIHYYEIFESKSEAIKRELFFKSIDGYLWLKQNNIT